MFRVHNTVTKKGRRGFANEEPMAQYIDGKTVGGGAEL